MTERAFKPVQKAISSSEERIWVDASDTDRKIISLGVKTEWRLQSADDNAGTLAPI